MTATTYGRLIAAPRRERLELFLAAANRLGAPVGHIEEGFRVCRALDTLYR